MLFLGVVIKFLDDEVDQDRHFKKYSEFHKELMQYRYPYGLLFLAIAMVLDTSYTFSLFTSAYMIGMFHFPKQELPLRLKAYEEIFIIVILNIILVPFLTFLHSLVIIILIQLIDDFLDCNYDMKYGYHNYAIQFGKGEVLLAGSIFFVLAMIMSWVNTLVILPTGILINYLYSKI